MRIVLFKTILVLGTLLQFSVGQDKSYPPAMVCKVTLTPNDSTKAIENRKAIQDSMLSCMAAIVYIDSGTYYIDSTLIWKKWKDSADIIRHHQEDENRRILAGKSKEKTKLILKSNLATSDSIVMLKPTDVPDGQGSAMGNGIWDMTVDIGTNNPKAIAILWRSNNWGSIKNVVVQSSDPGKAGNCGIKMDMTNAGPTLLKNVKIVGFNVGIRTMQDQTGITMENITLESQKIVGIKNCRNSLTIRNLTSNNLFPVIQNYLCSDIGAAHGGMVTLLNGTFNGGSPNVSAIENDFVGPLPSGSSPEMGYGSLFLRNISSTGYNSAVRNVPGMKIKQFVHGKNFSSGYKVTNRMPPNYPDTLPVDSTPEFHDPEFSHWVSVCGGGPYSENAWTATDHCLESALKTIDTTSDTSKNTLFFPPGHYYYTSGKDIPAKVKRIVGYGAIIFAKTNFSGNSQPEDSTLFTIKGNTTKTLYVDGLQVGIQDGGENTNRLLVFKHLSNRPVAISFAAFLNDGPGRIYRSSTTAGNLYLENIYSHGLSRWEFGKQQSVWARQLNPEGGSPEGLPKIHNNGGKLWVLGLKTENFTTVLRNDSSEQAGQAEIFGGYVFPADELTDTIAPVFENLNSKLTLVYAYNKYSNKTANCLVEGCGYRLQIRDIQGNKTHIVKTGEIAYSGTISRVMFFYGGPNAAFDRGGANFSAATHLLRKPD